MKDAQYDSQQGTDAQSAQNKQHRQPKEQASKQAYLETDGDQGNQDEISLVELWLKAKSLFAYLWRFKFFIIGVGLLFALGGYFKMKIAKPSYSASLNFALERGESTSALNGLATQFGISMGGGGEGLAGGDNLLALMRTRRIVQDVLFSHTYVNGDSILMLEQYLKLNGLLQSWESTELYPISKLECCNYKQDSALVEVVKAVSGDALSITKEIPKSSFVTVRYTGNDPIFAVAFIDLLTKKSTSFYVQTKMANSIDNINLLQRRLDSVRAELQFAMVGYYASQDQSAFLVKSTANVPNLQRQMKVNMLQAYYAELVKNLELSKTIMAREEPLFTIIDPPHYSVRRGESNLKFVIISGALGVFLSMLFIGVRAFLTELNKQAAVLKVKP